MLKERRWGQLYCLDATTGLIATAGTAGALFTVADGFWNAKDTLAAGLFLAGSLAFFQLRQRGYANGRTWLLCGFSALILIATVVLLRRHSMVYMVGSSILLLLGLALRSRAMSEAVSWRDRFPILCVTGSVLVSVAVAEVTLRLYPKALLSPWARSWILYQTGQDDWYIPHQYIGHLHNTDESKLAPPRLRQTKAPGKQDPWGFRNPWPWPKQVDILAVGDSFTYGFMVEYDQAWTTLLAREFTHGGVLNFGLVAGAPQQYLRIYETFGLDIAPKVLLVGLYLFNDLRGARDFERWWREGGKGAFLDFGDERPKPGWLRSIIMRVSPLYATALVRDVYESNRTPRFSELKTMALSAGERLQLFPSLLAAAAAYAHPDREEFKTILSTLERIQSLAQKNGTRCLVLFFPSKEEVYSPAIGEETVDLASRFIPELENRKISYLDLGPHFKNRAAKGESLFLETGPHPNDRGYALIASAVLAHLKDHAAEFGLTDWQGAISAVSR